MDATQIIGGLMLAVPLGIMLRHAVKCGVIGEVIFIVGASVIFTVWVIGALLLLGLRP